MTNIHDSAFAPFAHVDPRIARELGMDAHPSSQVRDSFEDDLQQVKQEELDLLLSKNKDYGPYNIARAPGGPLNGLAVRLHDKVARLAHLLEQGVEPEHESLQDTFLDIANYGTIGQLVCREEWPGVDR